MIILNLIAWNSLTLFRNRWEMRNAIQILTCSVLVFQMWTFKIVKYKHNFVNNHSIYINCLWKQTKTIHFLWSASQMALYLCGASECVMWRVPEKGSLHWFTTSHSSTVRRGFYSANAMNQNISLKGWKNKEFQKLQKVQHFCRNLIWLSFCIS